MLSWLTRVTSLSTLSLEVHNPKQLLKSSLLIYGCIGEVNWKANFSNLQWKLPHMKFMKFPSPKWPIQRCTPHFGYMNLLQFFPNKNNKGLLEFSNLKAQLSASSIVKMPLTNIHSTRPNHTIKMYTKTTHMCINLLHPLWTVKEQGPNLQI